MVETKNEMVCTEVECRAENAGNTKCIVCGKPVVGGHMAAVVYAFNQEVVVACRWHTNCKEDTKNIVTITGWRRKIYNTPAYTAWRTAVYERDGYTCAMCGEYNGKLQAHHIHPLHSAEDAYLVLDVKNGITLCRKCHTKIGGRENDYIDEFVAKARAASMCPRTND